MQVADTLRVGAMEELLPLAVLGTFVTISLMGILSSCTGVYLTPFWLKFIICKMVMLSSYSCHFFRLGVQVGSCHFLEHVLASPLAALR